MSDEIRFILPADEDFLIAIVTDTPPWVVFIERISFWPPLLRHIREEYLLP
ncbi:hypothetical protein [Haladaptatus litoreus]|nr:hypothetical protein [Haladaptatus litoreus]